MARASLLLALLLLAGIAFSAASGVSGVASAMDDFCSSLQSAASWS